MPIKNVIKSYKPESFYHIYNLGIENKIIFQDEVDYQTFISFLDQSLTPPKTKDEIQQNVTIKGSTFKGSPRQPKNLYGLLELHAYSLEPTNFHMLVKQKQAEGIETFMRSLGTRYVMYYNKRYQRRGPLFQGTYKATDITNEAMLLHLSRYIHQLPTSHTSYDAYKDNSRMPYVTTHEIVAMLDRDGFLKSMNPTYTHFIEKFQEDSSKILGPLTLI